MLKNGIKHFLDCKINAINLHFSVDIISQMLIIILYSLEDIMSERE